MFSQFKSKSSYLIEAVIKNRPILVKQAHKLFHNQAHAEDAAQDALVSVLSHLDDFRGDSQVSTWLYRVGTNAALMNLRKMKRAEERSKKASLQLPEGSQWLHGSCPPSPQVQFEGSERKKILLDAVDKLPDRYKKVVVLCDFDEQPLEQVAASLGLTVGGVRTRRLRAHRLLKDCLISKSNLNAESM